MHDGADMVDRPDGPEQEAAIRAGLARALASDALRGAPQLASFLGFIVERALAGRGGELKGYTIAVEALGRSADFDPQADPIVRVEGGRLRKALAQYYAGEGADDPVRIAVPVGAYVPVFRLATGGEAAPEDAGFGNAAPARADSLVAAAEARPTPAPEPESRRALAIFALALAAVVVLAALAAMQVGHRREAVSSRPPSQTTAVAPAGAPALPAQPASPGEPAQPAQRPQGLLPVVAVVTSDLADVELADVASRFTRLLVDAMARFDDLVTIRTAEAGGRAEADYVFEMSASRVGGAIEGFGRLRSVADGRIVWSTSAARRLGDGPDDAELLEIARRLAVRLVEPFGIIHADYRKTAASPAMACVFRALDMRRTMAEADHHAARACLEALVVEQPGFYPAWAQLALLTLDEYVHGFNARPGPTLDRALSAALTAMRLAPSSARAQQVMMDVLFARGAIEDALAAGREALARNPYDPDVLADLGSRFVRLNRPAEGLPLLDGAIALSAGRPPWYDFYAFLAAHLLGAEKLAESHAAALLADQSALSRLGRAMLAARRGDTIAAVAETRALAKLAPLFALDARLFLSRSGFSPELAVRVVSDLGKEAMSAAAPQ